MFPPQQAKKPYQIQMIIGGANFGFTSDLYMYNPVSRVDERRSASATSTSEEVSNSNNNS